MHTIQDIYDAINPLPAMLAAKGKKKPRVTIEFEANARVYIFLRWEKEFHKSYASEETIEVASGDDAEAAIKEAHAIINDLPSAADAKLHHFMGQLGKVIDAGNELGITVDFMNPLTETMKRISENVITFRHSEAAE
jgi:hypothetical protein